MASLPYATWSDPCNKALASMSIPHGILPNIVLRGKKYVDGYLADNVPIYPVLMEGCDTIYVVHLEGARRMQKRRLNTVGKLIGRMRKIDTMRQYGGWRYGFWDMYYEERTFEPVASALVVEIGGAREVAIGLAGWGGVATLQPTEDR